jgi:hypothetical protein
MPANSPLAYARTAVHEALRDSDAADLAAFWDGYADPAFECNAGEIISVCDDAGVFAPYRVSLWPVADGDGMIGGGLVTVDRPDGLRVATLHQDLRDWTVDRDAVGWAATFALLDAVVTAGQQALSGATSPCYTG